MMGTTAMSWFWIWPTLVVIGLALLGYLTCQMVRASTAMASPPEMSTCAASAAHASRKLAATTAAPNTSISTTGSSSDPVNRSTDAGISSTTQMPIERSNPSPRKRDRKDRGVHHRLPVSRSSTATGRPDRNVYSG